MSRNRDKERRRGDQLVEEGKRRKRDWPLSTFPKKGGGGRRGHVERRITPRKGGGRGKEREENQERGATNFFPVLKGRK